MKHIKAHAKATHAASRPVQKQSDISEFIGRWGF